MPGSEDEGRLAPEETAPARKYQDEYLPPAPPDALVQHRMHEESAENAWRRKSVSGLLNVFYALNAAVFGFIIAVWIGEVGFTGAPALLSERTLLALIAGSTAQLGALAYFVGRSLVAGKAENAAEGRGRPDRTGPDQQGLD